MVIYTLENQTINKHSFTLDGIIPANTVWIDLINVTEAEEQKLEKLLQINVPTPEETRNVSVSNRLYEEDNAIYMSITSFINQDKNIDELKPEVITFIVTKGILITSRDTDFNLFGPHFTAYSRKLTSTENIALNLLLMFLENIINETAAILEQIGHDLDAQNTNILNSTNNQKDPQFSHKNILREITISGNTVSKVRESLTSFNRMAIFLIQSTFTDKKPKILGHLKNILSDISALNDHATFISSKIIFLLDATLGQINIEQTNIIKIFSLVSVVFLPPLLIASIYGMNFKFIPELDWVISYPLILILMVLSSWLPYRYFKRKKWF